MAKYGFTVFTKPWKVELPQLASMVRQMGFDGVELPVRDGFQVEPARVEQDLPRAARILAEQNVRISSVASQPTPEVIRAMGQAGVKLLRVIFPVPRDANYLMYLNDRIGLLKSLVPALADAGVTIGLQQHCRRQINTSMETRYIVERFDPTHVGAIFDACHAALAGEEMGQSLDLIGSHLCLVNLKNAYWFRSNDASAQYAKWDVNTTTARHGMADWRVVAEELRKRNYSGDICLSAEYVDHSAGLENLLAEDLGYAKSLFG